MLTLMLALLSTGPLPELAQAAPVRVVTSLTTYAAIAREVVGDQGTVTAIALGDEDPHFVQPKPSFVSLLRNADLFVTTGLDLELWVPTLLDRAGNRKVTEGGPGYVTAYTGIDLMEVPVGAVSRSAGDIHIGGNPHIHTDPVNAIIISRNILVGLLRVAPDRRAHFTARQQDFERRVLEALIGTDLVRILTVPTAFSLLNTNQLDAFLARTMLEGKPLATRLGGWLQKAEVLRGMSMTCYHKEWAYFTRRFGIECIAFIEAKPGIPPTPGHVQEVIALMRERKVPALFASNYFSRSQITQVAERTGATAVVVPENTDGAPGVTTYFDLVNTWLNELIAVYRH